MSDENERSVASAGSVVGITASERLPDVSARDIVEALSDIASFNVGWPEAKRAIEEILRLRDEIEILRLRPAEREAIHYVVGDVADITGPVDGILRGLLERTK